MAEKFVIWWTSQEDWERITPLDSWPTWLYDEFRSRGGRAGRGRLWVPQLWTKGVPEGVSVEWDVANNWLCGIANDAGGIVIPIDALRHVQFLPGFVTTFDMTLPTTAMLEA